jgi:uncharacterized membrane protein
MTKSRLETFSDGVLAIIITIMVLELRVPHGNDLASLRPLLPVFTSYILSFIYIGIYWNNHHHMFNIVHHIDGRVMWKNMHLLFWLSLFPFGTSWMGENASASIPVAIYGVILICAGMAYYLLSRELIRVHGRDSLLAIAIGKDRKGIISVAIYAIGIAMAFVDTRISLGLYVMVAFIWFIPDRRIEKKVDVHEKID